MDQQNIEKEIKEIRERNRRVEIDKAWETSWTRRLFIAVTIYVVAAIWLLMISETNPWLKALIPSLGYILSTLSLPFIKSFWEK
ncbi:MAG: hypothetical protein A2751_03320 [Candidatus Doudnabacteria bacterium RIFCSPHIGHO2_01_FULL_46_14]|uniref:2TM domain-containing protein n=1 Tax=Candidatus Doudnabacteria bacterium RIFCSPHIGHO2_01_FULL_46_14 TaxID=1817824 RepID=A0A1F5NKV8_9BACT|nr:MAG: hypothetical protein A2751_03320 [Candidatus Doudnabacteria bacterium RIFCSPHIGHO2_01_FULL_46_14]